ncbi:MAG: Abi-alpha family protein [Burkholderiales bacterium]|nr:Abi-alpha family protein [Burkholderiales bacterium]
MSNEDPISETAKAVQEVAKATGKAIDAGQTFGGFISRYVAGSIEQGMGIFEDKLKYMRWERQVRLMQRSEQLLLEAGLTRPTRAIPLKLAIPLLEAASLEDDDYLQDLWARLLVNAANGGSHVSLHRAYIAVLEQLTPLEAVILQKIYSLPFDETRHNGVEAGKLPDDVAIWKDFGNRDSLPEPPEEVRLALANLARLDCIAIQKSAGGGEMFKRVIPTLLGKSFVEACTLRVA